jgi:hypothetical protein
LDFKKYSLSPRVTRDLKKRSTIGIGFYFIVMGIILFSHRYYERHPEFSWTFLSFVIGICLLRLLHLAVYQRIPPKFRKLNTVLFLLSIASTALIWGVGCAAFMIQDGETDTKLLVVICTMGLCSGGAVAYNSGTAPVDPVQLPDVGNSDFNHGFPSCRYSPCPVHVYLFDISVSDGLPGEQRILGCP